MLFVDFGTLSENILEHRKDEHLYTRYWRIQLEEGSRDAHSCSNFLHFRAFFDNKFAK